MKIRQVRALLPEIFFLGIGCILLVRLFRLSVDSASDFEVYWYAIRAWVAGQSPYAHYSPVYPGLVFKYPPWILPLHAFCLAFPGGLQMDLDGCTGFMHFLFNELVTVKGHQHPVDLPGLSDVLVDVAGPRPFRSGHGFSDGLRTLDSWRVKVTFQKRTQAGGSFLFVDHKNFHTSVSAGSRGSGCLRHESFFMGYCCSWEAICSSCFCIPMGLFRRRSLCFPISTANGLMPPRQEERNSVPRLFEVSKTTDL